ncbi:MAG: NUDIX hydrolase [Chloroflexota bacterium]
MTADNPFKPWKTLDRQQLYHDDRMHLERRSIELPDGSIITNWLWIDLPDYVIVTAVTHDGMYLCFRQTKYPVSGTTLAPVGGYIDPGESPFDAARRELMEETGYRSDRWIELGEYVVDGNRGAGMAHLFLATDAAQVADPVSDDLEEQELLLLTRKQIAAALDSGQFRVLPWTTALALALRHS